MPIQITYQFSSDVLTARGHARLMREVNRATIEHLRDEFLPDHFENNPKTRPGGAYGYVARTKRYQIRKAKRRGHQLPHVWTGQERQFVQANSKTTATQHRARLYARNHFPMRAQHRRELEAVALEEKRQLVEFAANLYVEGTQDPKYRAKRVRRGR